ncbi:Hypothetical predicted protein, partial [Pelobates cultripes]
PSFKSLKSRPFTALTNIAGLFPHSSSDVTGYSHYLVDAIRLRRDTLRLSASLHPDMITIVVV